MSSMPPPDEALLRNLLERVARGEVSVEAALPQVKLLTQQSLQMSGAASLQAFSNLLRPAMQRQAAAGTWIAGGILALIGTIFFLVGVGIGWRSIQFMDAARADGVVIRVANGKPTVRYAVQNQDYEVIGSVSSKPPSFAVGEKVTVLYKPEKPADAQIDGFVERWLFLTIFGGIGFILGLIGWSLLFFRIVARLFRARPVDVDEAQRFTIE